MNLDKLDNNDLYLRIAQCSYPNPSTSDTASWRLLQRLSTLSRVTKKLYENLANEPFFQQITPHLSPALNVSLREYKITTWQALFQLWKEPFSTNQKDYSLSVEQRAFATSDEREWVVCGLQNLRQEIFFCSPKKKDSYPLYNTLYPYPVECYPYIAYKDNKAFIISGPIAMVVFDCVTKKIIDAIPLKESPRQLDIFGSELYVRTLNTLLIYDLDNTKAFKKKYTYLPKDFGDFYGDFYLFKDYFLFFKRVGTKKIICLYSPDKNDHLQEAFSYPNYQLADDGLITIHEEAIFFVSYELKRLHLDGIRFENGQFSTRIASFSLPEEYTSSPFELINICAHLDKIFVYANTSGGISCFAIQIDGKHWTASEPYTFPSFPYIEVGHYKPEVVAAGLKIHFLFLLWKLSETSGIYSLETRVATFAPKSLI